MKESQIRVLESLAQFKFLNSNHLLALGIIKQRPNLYRILPALRDGRVPYVTRLELFRLQLGTIYTAWRQ